MLYSAFRKTLSDFVNRKDVTTAQLDFFVNTAKNNLQLVREWNFTRKRVELTYPTTAGEGVTLPSDYKSMAGDRAVWFVGDNGNLVPIRGSSFETESRRLMSRLSHSSTWLGVQGIWPGSGRPVFYVEIRSGERVLFLNPEPTGGRDLVAYYVSWITDYGIDGTREDFLMQYGTQVLLYDATSVANTFVSEEYKIEVNQTLRDKALMGLIDYDARIAHDGETFDLR